MMANYVNDFFTKNNDTYYRLPFKKIGQRVLTVKLNKKSNKIRFDIKTDVVNNRGYCNFRFSNCDLIESVALEIGNISLVQVHNSDGKILHKLRDILGIVDNTVLPFLPKDAPIPFLDLYECCIHIELNNKTKNVDLLSLTYDEIEFDSDLYILAQYNDVSKIKHLPLNKYSAKLVPILEFYMLSIFFTGAESTMNKNIVYNICDPNIVNTILVYTPNNNIESYNVRLDGKEILTSITTQGEFSIIKINKFLNPSKHSIVLRFDLKVQNDKQKFYVYTIGRSLNRIISGRFYTLEM